MGCNCNKSKKTTNTTEQEESTQSFALMTPDSRVQTFGSRLEAEAARVRAGGTGQIRTL
jgi:hypothetical protein